MSQLRDKFSGCSTRELIPTCWVLHEQTAMKEMVDTEKLNTSQTNNIAAKDGSHPQRSHKNRFVFQGVFRLQYIVVMDCDGKGGAVSPTRTVGWSLLPFNLTRRITNVLLMVLLISKSAGAKRPVAFEFGQTLPQALIALEEKEVVSSCYCRIKCMMNMSCTAVSVLVNKDSGVTNCLFSNTTIPLGKLSEADSAYTWVHNATNATNTEANSSTTSEILYDEELNCSCVLVSPQLRVEHDAPKLNPERSKPILNDILCFDYYENEASTPDLRHRLDSPFGIFSPGQLTVELLVLNLYCLEFERACTDSWNHNKTLRCTFEVESLRVYMENNAEHDPGDPFPYCHQENSRHAPGITLQSFTTTDSTPYVRTPETWNQRFIAFVCQLGSLRWVIPLLDYRRKTPSPLQM
ncbi:uncharacterized protein LOC135198944 [Macrobrachium nipponense]|uniref:uncharacterized protein LOC135198944 n=1 Tax=Macrobrachium nipponense TaxID=159736 RepID=UPI0030C8599B